MAFKMTKPTFGKSPVEMNSPFKGDKQEDIANKKPVVSSESPGPNWVKEKGTNQWTYVEPPVVEEPVVEGEFSREEHLFPPESSEVPQESPEFPPERVRDLTEEQASKFNKIFEEDEEMIWGEDEDGNPVTDLDKWTAMGGI